METSARGGCAAGTRADYHTSLLNGTLANQLPLSGLRARTRELPGDGSHPLKTVDQLGSIPLSDANWRNCTTTNSEHNCDVLQAPPLPRCGSCRNLHFCWYRACIVVEQNQVEAHLDRARHGRKLSKPSSLYLTRIRRFLYGGNIYLFIYL